MTWVANIAETCEFAGRLLGEKNLTGVWPPLRWPGGKRWLARQLAPFVADVTEQRYFEPFLGGGALFFTVAPNRAFLSDVNAELISTYKTIKREPSRLERAIEQLPIGKDAYYDIRSEMPRNNLDRAARFLYLNRAGFSGLHRTNKRGEFNVPFGGRSPEILIRKSLIQNASRVLQRAQLGVLDFEDAIRRAGAGDFVYCDPVYALPRPNGSFDRYNNIGFSWADQERLSIAAKGARERGALVLVSNVADSALQKLYHPFRPLMLRRPSRVAASGSKRGSVDEFLFVLAPSSCRKARVIISRMLEEQSGVDDATVPRAA